MVFVYFPVVFITNLLLHLNVVRTIVIPLHIHSGDYYSSLDITVLTKMDNDSYLGNKHKTLVIIFSKEKLAMRVK